MEVVAGSVFGAAGGSGGGDGLVATATLALQSMS